VFHIVVCGSVAPDPLQTLEPVAGSAGPGLKNEMLLPHVLDPWAAHALYEAAALAKSAAGSKIWLVSLGPKAKLQQVMMTMAQKAPFDLLALDGPASGFTDASETAAALADAICGIPGLDWSRLLVFGGWESATRCAGATLQLVGERLGIVDQFLGVDRMTVLPDGSAAKCTFYGDRAVGDIGEGLRTCWQRIRPVKLESLDCKCEYLEACRGGCRYRAELLENPQGRDLYRCSLYGVIDKAE